MVHFKVVFSIDPHGFDKDITEYITIKNNATLYSLNDKNLRLLNEVKIALELKGYYFDTFFLIKKINAL